mmetsp:Transcript_6756/g.11339  ORF Transcript_6756/g.11339 Transcript_6756/m.11339 type:complete len:96 (-) Transcript_6756:730-1017(-)
MGTKLNEKETQAIVDSTSSSLQLPKELFKKLLVSEEILLQEEFKNVKVKNGDSGGSENCVLYEKCLQSTLSCEHYHGAFGNLELTMGHKKIVLKP